MKAQFFNDMLRRLSCLVIVALLLYGCSALQQTAPVSETASIQNQRSASAELELLELGEIDSLIKLNNRVLSSHIKAEIETLATSAGRYKLRNTKLIFKRQFIYLESLVDFLDENNDTVTGLASGEVLLHFSGDRLEWFPRFSQLGINSRNFNFQGAHFSEPTPEITQLALQNLNADISAFLMQHNGNVIPLNVVPLAEIQLGASLPGLSTSSALLTRQLTGMSRVIDSVILIDSGVTSVALDLEFKPVRTNCPPESGCTMYAEAAFNPDPEIIITHVSNAEARRTFALLKDEFENRISGFYISEQKPDIALIETRREFLRELMQAVLADLNVDARFDIKDLSFPEFSARLQPFDADSFICERRNCPAMPVCKADLTQCKRLRDTRDCSTCVFRNPLNNRCVSKEIDPQCESERQLQNSQFDDQRTKCIAEAENLKRNCDNTNAQSHLSCEQESESVYAYCESVKRDIDKLGQGASLASISARVQASGSLIANFSNVRIEGDLSRLKLDIGLKSDLHLQGKLRFKPFNKTQPLVNCITHWNGTFNSRFIARPAVNKLMSKFEENRIPLTANWSGFGLTIKTEPSPLESILKSPPGLLSSCNIGLSMNAVEQALAGEDVKFLLGQLDLEIQPLPTIIRFNPATISLGERTFSGYARLSNNNLSYEIAD